MDRYLDFLTQHYKSDDYYIQKKAQYSIMTMSLTIVAILIIISLEFIIIGLDTYKVVTTSLFILGFMMLPVLVYKGKLYLSINIMVIATFLRMAMIMFYPTPFQFYGMGFLNCVIIAVIHVKRYQIYSIYTGTMILFVYKVGVFYTLVEEGAIHYRAFTQSLYTVVIFMLFVFVTNFIVRIIDDEINKTKELVWRAHTDVLTGLSNRRSFEDDYLTLTEAGASIAGIILDIDKFKLINDRYGHKVGDQVLKAFADLLLSETTDVSKIYRWGGEEFLILIPNVSLKEAYELAETLRTSVMKLKLLSKVSFTVSSGVGLKENNESIDEFVSRIDKALYLSKDNGRNKSTKSV